MARRCGTRCTCLFCRMATHSLPQPFVNFLPWMGHTIVASSAVSTTMAEALATGKLTRGRKLKVLNANQDVLHPILAQAPHAAQPHVLLFGGGWDSSFSNLLSPGATLFHEAWVRAPSGVGKAQSPTLALSSWGAVAATWTTAEGRDVRVVATNSKWVADQMGWPDWTSVFAGTTLYASAHDMWGLVTGSVFESAYSEGGGDRG